MAVLEGKLWKLTTSYSWGEEEEPVYFRSWENAKNEMLKLAGAELICAGQNHEYQVHMIIPEDIGITENKRSSVELYYDYDNTVCYYVIEQEDTCADCLDVDDDEEKLEVETSAGIIRAYKSTTPEQPGIIVMLQPKGSDAEIDVSYVSTYEDPGIATSLGEHPEDVVILTYGDAYQEDYTHKAILRREDVVRSLNI